MFNDVNHPYNILKRKYSLFAKNRLVQEKISAIAWIISNERPLVAITHLFPYLLVKHEKMAVKSTIAQSIAFLMQNQVEQNGRHLFGYRFILLRTIELRIDDIQTLQQFDEKLTLLGIASMNANGYVREAALTLLDEVAVQSETLPYLLALMNDHVPAIRTQALDLINRNIPHYPLQTFIKYHKGFDYLNDLKYAQEYQLVTKMHGLIRENEHRHDILQNLNAYKTNEIIVIIDTLHEDIKKDPRLFETILRKINPFIFSAIQKHFDGTYFSEATLHKLLNSKYPKIRRETLLLLSTEQVRTFRDVIYALLQDTSINVRQTARYVLQDETINIASYYRELVQSSTLHAKAGAIMGFADSAQLEDIPLLKNYMTHSSKLVRTAIYANLYRLAGESVISLIIKGLLDKSESVRALVVNIMRKSPANDDLVRTYFNEGNATTKKSCFAILSSRRSYQALNDILMAELNNDKQHPLPIANKITIWTNTFYPKIYAPLSDDLYHDIMAKLKVLDPKKERYYYLYPLLDLVHKR